MAMISCLECGAQVSDKAESCIKCGYPIITCSECNTLVSDNLEACAECGCPIKKATLTQGVAPKPRAIIPQGKATFQATGDFIGLVGKYVIMDGDGNTLAKIKAMGCFEIKIDIDTVFYLKYSGGFGKPTQVMARANKVNRYTLGLNRVGTGLNVESD